MSKAKQILRPALSLCIICAVVTLALAVVYYFTADVIEANIASKSQEGAYSVMSEAASFDTLDPVGEAQTVYRALDTQGETLGYVFQTAANGYGGEIIVLTGIRADGTVSGVGILSDSETPGLGKKVEQDAFREQYQGKAGILSVAKQNPSSDQIQAVSGATVSSKAVTSAVNAAREAFEQLEEIK